MTGKDGTRRCDVPKKPIGISNPVMGSTNPKDNLFMTAAIFLISDIPDSKLAAR
jgi:hypothetical protein